MGGKVARRSFLKLIGAAPVAAPAVAKASVLEIERAIGRDGVESNFAYGGMANTMEACGPADGGAYWRGELERLLMRRKHVCEHHPKSQSGLASDIGIDGLRSVSPVNRARMLAEDRLRREKERGLSRIDERIAEAKAKLGPLGELL